MEGDIEDVDGVLRITKIRLRFQFQVPFRLREKAQRALETYSTGCPAYQSVKDCIQVSWTAEMEDAP